MMFTVFPNNFHNILSKNLTDLEQSIWDIWGMLKYTWFRWCHNSRLCIRTNSIYNVCVPPHWSYSNHFADDNFIILFNPQINALIVNMQMRLVIIIRWQKELGLKVNENKMKLCLFYRNDTEQLRSQFIINKFPPKT